jgi:hypothetical protein
MRPSTRGPNLKEEVYHRREGPSYALAAPARVRWQCCAPRMRPYACAIG